MTDDLAKAARAAITIWEANPKRQALAKMLNCHPGQISDEDIRRVERGPGNMGPPMQQIPRTPRKRTT